MKSKLIASILSLFLVGGVGTTIHNNSNKVAQSENNSNSTILNKDIETGANTTKMENDANGSGDNVVATKEESNGELQVMNLSSDNSEIPNVDSFSGNSFKGFKFKHFWWSNNSCSNNNSNSNQNKPENNEDNSGSNGSGSNDSANSGSGSNGSESNGSVDTPSTEDKPSVLPGVEEKPVTPPSTEDKPVTPTDQEEAPSVDSNFLAQVESMIFNKVNEERAKAGVPALTYNNTMQKYARIKSQDMGDKGYFSHEDLNGNLITVQMKNDGVSYSAWGENIAYISGVSDSNALANQFMTNWMNSDGHRKNILSTNFSGIGVGVYKVGNKVYATQEFHR